VSTAVNPPARPPFLEPDGQGGQRVTQAWKDAYTFRVTHPTYGVHEYCPTAKGLDFHESPTVNVLIEGSRGTGKSMIIRNDAHMRALAYPGYTYLIVRRTMPELKKSHLKFIGAEMRKLGGTYHKTDYIATYPNGSVGFFSHCETEDDMLKLLSSEYCAIYFDEISTFTWAMVAKIASCVRVPENSGLTAIVRAGTNPIGVGAAEARRYFITKDVNPEDDPDYDAYDWHSIHTTLDDNPYIDKKQYIKRLGASGLPEHVRRAWLDGEWIIEGAYFHDYKPTIMKEGKVVPWHVVEHIPVIKARNNDIREAHQHQWIQIYRALDWGFSPDPCVCLWIAVLPNGRAFVLKELQWKSKPAKVVAEDIIRQSAGMNIVETYCDPTMFYGSAATDQHSIGDIFEEAGVWLTPSKNDRAQAGYAIHEFLNTICDDGAPQLQIYNFGCPNLVRTFPEQRVDKNHPEKIGDGNDHWVIALSYFCTGRVGRSFEHDGSELPRWMRPKVGSRQGRFGFRLGQESSRSSIAR